jgi:hypothetical protein
VGGFSDDAKRLLTLPDGKAAFHICMVSSGLIASRALRKARVNTDIVVEVMGSAIAMGVRIPVCKSSANELSSEQNADNARDIARLRQSTETHSLSSFPVY